MSQPTSSGVFCSSHDDDDLVMPCEKVSFMQPSMDVFIMLFGFSTVKLPNVNQMVVMCEQIIPAAAPFQFAIGTRMANRNTPSRGPDVTLVISMALSITPDSRPTLNATPIMTTENMTPTSLITFSCCLSVYPLKCGSLDMKSSHVTVAREFTLDTFRLEIERGRIGNTTHCWPT